jgi:hypothetical protein
MFAQLRKSATVTEKLKPMIQGKITARSDRAAADWHKEFSLKFGRSENLRKPACTRRRQYYFSRTMGTLRKIAYSP